MQGLCVNEPDRENPFSPPIENEAGPPFRPGRKSALRSSPRSSQVRVQCPGPALVSAATTDHTSGQHPQSSQRDIIIIIMSSGKPSATFVPGGGAGKTTWIKPEGQKTTLYTPDGAQAKPMGVKKMVPGNSVQQRIRGLQDNGIKTVPTTRKMKTPKIVTDTKESWDNEGNITREITRYITDIDGTKRTEKEVIHIPAKK